MGTWGGSTPVLPPVDVLVFCVPIPTSHYSSSHQGKEWDVDACALLTAWFPVCRAVVVCPCSLPLCFCCCSRWECCCHRCRCWECCCCHSHINWVCGRWIWSLGALFSRALLYFSVQQKTHQSTVFSTVADRCSVQQSPPQHHLFSRW